MESDLLAIRFRQMPIKLTITNKDFAERLNITPQMLVRYQKGETIPTADILIRIKTIFNFDMNWLLNEKEKDEFVKKQIICRPKICYYSGA